MEDCSFPGAVPRSKPSRNGQAEGRDEFEVPDSDYLHIEMMGIDLGSRHFDEKIGSISKNFTLISNSKRYLYLSVNLS